MDDSHLENRRTFTDGDEGPAFGVIDDASPRQNHLLAALPPAEFARLAPCLEPVNLSLGEVISDSGTAPQHVYFPTSAILSLQYLLEDGSSTEVAGVGSEGLFGMSLCMGEVTVPSRLVVQTAGRGYRVAALRVAQELHRPGVMQNLVLRHVQALFAQVGQTAVCNRHHPVDQRLCRSLLLTVDRTRSNELVMTHEHLASALGVRRERVTAAAGRLQRAGAICYRRGHITVLDRRGLEARVCECYGVVNQLFARLRTHVPYWGGVLHEPHRVERSGFGRAHAAASMQVA
jgi:CRP-like cAMP-binding protein